MSGFSIFSTVCFFCFQLLYMEWTKLQWREGSAHLSFSGPFLCWVSASSLPHIQKISSQNFSSLPIFFCRDARFFFFIYFLFPTDIIFFTLFTFSQQNISCGSYKYTLLCSFSRLGSSSDDFSQRYSFLARNSWFQ